MDAHTSHIGTRSFRSHIFAYTFPEMLTNASRNRLNLKGLSLELEDQPPWCCTRSMAIEE
jgi:hypothetical protein